MEANRIHTAAPVVDVVNAVSFELRDGHGARGERALAHVMNVACPLPDCGGKKREVILGGETCDIRLVDSNGWDPQLTGRNRASRTEDERAGEVHDIRLELR